MTGTAHELAPYLDADHWQVCVLCGTRIVRDYPLPWGTVTVVENYVQRGPDGAESPPRRAILAGFIAGATYCVQLTMEAPRGTEQR